VKRLIKKILRETTLTESIPGNPKSYSTATGLYGNVQPSYNFKSRGPVPGRMYSPGFNYESKGPLGVSYFTEGDSEEPNPWAVCTSSLGLEGKKRKDYTKTEKANYEKCVLGVKKEIKESHINRVVNRVINESSHGGSYMAKKQLWGIAEKAKEMAERLPDNTQLEDWMESHIAKADSMMDSVYDSFDYDNQSEIPGFEGTMDMLDDLSIREQETKYRDMESGKKVESSVQLDLMTDYLEDIYGKVSNIQDSINKIIDLR